MAKAEKTAKKQQACKCKKQQQSPPEEAALTVKKEEKMVLETAATKDFYMVKEIAEKSGLSYGTIKRAIDGGNLAAYRIGRKYFIAKAAGEAFCRENYRNQNVEGYTIQEIMEKIPLSYAFLMELVKSKKLPTTKKGRQYIVAYEDYEEFIKNCKI